MTFTIILTLVFISLAVWLAAFIESKIDSPKDAHLIRPLLDVIKLVSKEAIMPKGASSWFFFIMPVVVMTLTVGICSILPIAENTAVADLNIGVAYAVCLLLLCGYSLIITGWSSKSRYSLLGSFRLGGQLMVYIVIFALVLATISLSAGSLNIKDIIAAQDSVWFLFPHFPLFIVFLFAMLVLTNRMPGDAPTSDSEISGGINSEFSGIALAMLLIAQYVLMLVMSALAAVLFLGGGHALFEAGEFMKGMVWFAVKILLCMAFFIWVKAALPRYRYDQVMRIGYKYLIPASGLWFLFTACFLLWERN